MARLAVLGLPEGAPGALGEQASGLHGAVLELVQADVLARYHRLRLRRSWINNPHRVHVIGKDILQFHAVYWPAPLLSAGLPVPTRIIVHGFLTRDGRRMRKTLGAGIDPATLATSWGVDTVRYWLLREARGAGRGRATECWRLRCARRRSRCAARAVSLAPRARRRLRRNVAIAIFRTQALARSLKN